MITGRQILQGRRMLGWDRETLSVRANITARITRRAEFGDGVPFLSLFHVSLIRQALERAGIRFGQNGAVLKVATEKKA